MSNPQGLDQALRLLAIAAAEAGLIQHAASLATYADTNLGAYRGSNGPWIEPRLERALHGAPDEPPPVALHRREIMNLVDELEAALARDDVT